MRDLTASQRKIIGSERHIWPNELAFAEAIYADRLELIQRRYVGTRLVGCHLV